MLKVKCECGKAYIRNVQDGTINDRTGSVFAAGFTVGRTDKATGQTDKRNPEIYAVVEEWAERLMTDDERLAAVEGYLDGWANFRLRLAKLESDGYCRSAEHPE